MAEHLLLLLWGELRRRYLGTWFSGEPGIIMNEWLDLTTLEVFSILNDPMAENHRLPALEQLKY